MKFTSRFHGKSVRLPYATSLRPLLAFAAVLALQEAVSGQDASTSAPALPPTPAPDSSFGSDTNYIKIVKPPSNQIGVSGDYSLDQGKITFPVGYSLNASLEAYGVAVARAQEVIASPKRNSDYYGATLSYSHGQTWFFDVSYAQGKSTGSQDINFGSRYGDGSGDFTLDDDWYQAYVRYAFKNLFKSPKLSAYARVGATYVDSKLDFASTTPLSVLGLYSQTDKTTDIYGNVGFGAIYTLKTFDQGRFIIGLQGEIEGLGGTRSQDSLETLRADNGLVPVTAHIDNTVYGGLGKGTLHLEYQMGKHHQFRLFLDGGAQYQYLEVSYPGAGDQNETLYGPYVKLGLRYSF